MISAFWTKERVEELTQLWNSDHSSQDISERWGISRSAVVGKVYRLRRSGIPLRTEYEAARIHRTKAQHRRRKERASAVPGNFRYGAQPKKPSALLAQLLREAKAGAPILPQATDVPRKALLDLEDRDCRFPCTTGPPHRFCAAPRIPGLPYCLDHARRALRLVDNESTVGNAAYGRSKSKVNEKV